jgi:hypothetical protein
MLAQRIAEIDCVEDLFKLLKLDFDKHAVKIYRLHMLKYFGQMIEEIEERSPPPSEEDRAILYASALLQAHDRYALRECSCEPSVFPGVRQGLVPLGLKKRDV